MDNWTSLISERMRNLGARAKRARLWSWVWRRAAAVSLGESRGPRVAYPFSLFTRPMKCEPFLLCVARNY